MGSEKIEPQRARRTQRKDLVGFILGEKKKKEEVMDKGGMVVGIISIFF